MRFFHLSTIFITTTISISLFRYLLKKNTGYLETGKGYISRILRLMFSISSRSSLFSFIFSSTFVTEYMMVV